MNKERFSNRKETEYPGQIHFHYNREERYSTLAPDIVNRDSQKKRGLFRKNRSLLILFLDVLFILVLAFVIVPLLNRRASITETGNYKMQFRAFLYEDAVFLSLKIEAAEDIKAMEQNTVTVRFRLAEGEGSETLIDLLPEQKGEIRMYRGKIDGGEGKQTAFAEVTIGDTTTELKTEVVPEQE